MEGVVNCISVKKGYIAFQRGSLGQIEALSLCQYGPNARKCFKIRKVRLMHCFLRFDENSTIAKLGISNFFSQNKCRKHDFDKKKNALPNVDLVRVTLFCTFKATKHSSTDIGCF